MKPKKCKSCNLMINRIQAHRDMIRGELRLIENSLIDAQRIVRNTSRRLSHLSHKKVKNRSQAYS